MTPDTFLTFLTFLTQKLAVTGHSTRRQDLEIPPYARHERFDRPTVGSDAGDLVGRSKSKAITGRQRLPNRRGHELLDFEHGGIRYTAGVGRFEDGRPAEIFLNTAKHGTAVDTNARDAAVAASLLLQHVCPLETLRRALTRNADGSASGALARALDLLAIEQPAEEQP
jgi:hypothetical protein